MHGKRISIDKGRCDGCGLCVEACHEGALAIIDGKAALVREDYCDGLGDCLPACPQGAITFAEPSTSQDIGLITPGECTATDSPYQWPIQLALVNPGSSYLRGNIVIAADCTAFVVDDFRQRILSGRPVIIGCPKLDDRSRFDKVMAILSNGSVEKVTVVRMEVQCCRALVNIVRAAAERCGRDLPVEEIVLSRSGAVIGRSRPSRSRRACQRSGPPA